MKHKIRFSRDVFMNYQRIIRHYASEAYKSSPDQIKSWIEINDLVQEGNIALVEAIRKYRPGKEAKFSTFLILILQRTYLDFFRFHNRKMRNPGDGKLFRIEAAACLKREPFEILKVELELYLDETGQSNLRTHLE